MCNSAPDTSGINAAAQQSSQISQQALDWYTGEMDRTQGQRDQSAQTQNDVAAQELAAMKQQSALASDYDAYNKSTYRPLEQSIVSQAQQYNTPERQEAAAAAARADVHAAQAGQQTAAAQSLARMGYDPSVNSTKMAAQEALAEAGAATRARTTTEATGHAMEMDAASLGRNLPSAQATAIQTGSGAGQVASGAAGAAVNTQGQGAAMMGQGFGLGLQGQQVAGNLYGQQSQLQYQDNSGLFGMLGSLGGAAISHYSSKKLKTPGKPMPDKVALEAVAEAHDGAPAAAPPADAKPGRTMMEPLARMSNDVWGYHPGVEDGGVHVGPYAEEAHAHQGGLVAPGGRGINVHHADDYNGKAIAEMSKRIEHLSRALAAA